MAEKVAPIAAMLPRTKFRRLMVCRAGAAFGSQQTHREKNLRLPSMALTPLSVSI